MIKRDVIGVSLILLLILLPACTPLWGNSEDLGVETTWTETPTPFGPIEIPTQIFLPTIVSPFNVPTEQIPTIDRDLQIWASNAVPILLSSYLKSSDYKITSDENGARYHLVTKPLKEEGLSAWIYVLVVPFPTITDGIKWEEFLNLWQGGNTGPFANLSIWMDPATFEALKSLIGAPANGKIRITTAEEISNSAMDEQSFLAIVPFEALEPHWKVINLDGQSPISKTFNVDNYPLKVNFGFNEGETPEGIKLPASNRDPEKLTILVMTGVTALVRATAAKMERNGVLYPSEDIRDWLLAADLTHISNEIPFAEDCPFPNPNQETLVFCSDPKYISLLEDVGTDIVELTGNHFQDWGSDATKLTIQMYKQRGWLYYGGGIDLADARAAKLIINNGNKFAFIGCNPAGPVFAWATEFQPGAAPCDYAWMQSEVSRLRTEGYLPIVTFQYNESYSVQPLPEQTLDFQHMANAGAVIVSGSQAHLPQTMEFIKGSFIHYGLGNLFFDQMDYPVIGTRREFIDRHIFYNGKYISTELLTAMLEDYSRPRPMTQEERALFLEEIFRASGW